MSSYSNILNPLFAAQLIARVFVAVLVSPQLASADTKVEMKVVILVSQHSANLATSKAVCASASPLAAVYRV